MNVRPRLRGVLHEAAFAISMLLIVVAFAVILALRGRFLR